MRKVFLIAAICAACAAAAGCSAKNSGTPSEVQDSTVSESTVQATVQTTAEPGTTEPATTKQATTEPVTTETETTVPETDSGDAEIKALLTQGRWVLKNVYVDGELYQGNYYGSIITQTGAYMEFLENDTFSCSLGFTYCSGTYSVDGGEVNLHLTQKSNEKSIPVDTDETGTIELDRENKTIMFDFSSTSTNVTNEFVLN